MCLEKLFEVSVCFRSSASSFTNPVASPFFWSPILLDKYLVFVGKLSVSSFLPFPQISISSKTFLVSSLHFPSCGRHTFAQTAHWIFLASWLPSITLMFHTGNSVNTCCSHQYTLGNISLTLCPCLGCWFLLLCTSIWPGVLQPKRTVHWSAGVVYQNPR